jgi:hypothetical protein
MAEGERTILIRETKEPHDYDRRRALRVYEALRGEIAAGYYGDAQGYGPRDDDADDDRIVALFELLDGSMFGDWIFSGTDFDHGVELVTRGEDE